MAFIDGKRLRVDPVTGLTKPFFYNKKKHRDLPKRYVLVNDEKPADEKQADKGQKVHTGVNTDRKALIAKLAAAGVTYKGNKKTADLQAMWDEHLSKANPAGSGVPSKEEQIHAGVGNQEVI